MEEISSRIVYLIEKHLNEALSQQEAIELESWKQQRNGNRAFFDKLTNDDYVKNIIAGDANSDSKERVRRKIKMLIENDQEVMPSATEAPEIKIWPRFMAAASIILVLGVTAYFLYTKGHPHLVKNTPAVVFKADDAPPGKFKARLTLADGSTVSLDSAVNGTLAQQGSTSVMNKDGKLIYQSNGKPNEVLYNTLATSRGQTYATVLGDGTKVWLNSESSIRYPVAFSGTSREVEITGEAYLEVEHDASRPFYVKVNGMTIQDLGTHFNVNGYNDEPEIKTTLLEGKVMVKNGNALTILLPGQQTNLNKETQQLSKIKEADVDEAVAWRNGYFDFNEANLQNVLRQLARWYDVDVVYQGKVSQETFWGKILRSNNLSQVLETLHASDVHFKIEGRKIIVTP